MPELAGRTEPFIFSALWCSTMSGSFRFPFDLVTADHCEPVRRVVELARDHELDVVVKRSVRANDELACPLKARFSGQSLRALRAAVAA